MDPTNLRRSATLANGFKTQGYNSANFVPRFTNEGKKNQDQVVAGCFIAAFTGRAILDFVNFG
jgi:hypothetical protein